ncbi:MAG: hypothetical protein PHW73_01040 [Atribacterota bacterium]|nr:hypothetical protein [Atribacterota bacterium]
MIIIKIISTAIEKGKLIVKVLGLGSKDIKSIYNILPFGIDSNPSKDYRAIYADTGVNGEKILLGIIYTKVIAEVGEMRLYSEDNNGDEVFSLHLKKDGTCEIGGNADNAVRYTKLKKGFDKLLEDHNKLLDAFNQHMHPTAGTGAPSPPTAVPDLIPAIVSQADISESKIDNIKTS